MKSLHKALDILEYVLNADGKAVTPTAASEACGINIATTTRVLGEFTKRAYLKKVSRNTGYVPGPILYSLADRRCFYGRVSHAASDILKDLAINLDTQVNISVMEGAYRYILCHFSANEMLTIRSTAHLDDHYTSGTGRVLLSNLDAKSIDEIVERIGLPGKRWPEVKSRRDLDLHLARIRKAGHATFSRQIDPKHKIVLNFCGVMINVENHPVCAIGAAINANRPNQNMLEEMESAAARIKENIEYQLKSY